MENKKFSIKDAMDFKEITDQLLREYRKFDDCLDMEIPLSWDEYAKRDMMKILRDHVSIEKQQEYVRDAISALNAIYSLLEKSKAYVPAKREEEEKSHRTKNVYQYTATIYSDDWKKLDALRYCDEDF